MAVEALDIPPCLDRKALYAFSRGYFDVPARTTGRAVSSEYFRALHALKWAKKMSYPSNELTHHIQFVELCGWVVPF